MSYSRWSYSRWYTYHDASSGDKKQDQIFTVCSVRSFKFEEISQDILGCARFCCESEESENIWWKDGNHFAQYWELVAFMSCFMNDMEIRFNSKTKETDPTTEPAGNDSL